MNVKPSSNNSAWVHRRLSCKRQNGFTLIEILIAVAVVAIALSAIVTEVSRDLHYAHLLRNKTLAQWVAMNKITEWQITENWPDPGQQQGETEMARQTWYWRINTSTTDDKNIRRLDVEVSDQKDNDNLVTLLAYLSKPMP